MSKKKDDVEKPGDDFDLDLELEKTQTSIKPPEAKPKPAEVKSKPAEDLQDEVADLSEDIPVKLVAVMGRKQMVLKDLLKLKIGQTIDLDRPPNEFVDVTAGGKVIAKGELVEIDGKLGVRIIKMLK